MCPFTVVKLLFTTLGEMHQSGSDTVLTSHFGLVEMILVLKRKKNMFSVIPLVIYKVASEDLVMVVM